MTPTIAATPTSDLSKSSLASSRDSRQSFIIERYENLGTALSSFVSFERHSSKAMTAALDKIDALRNAAINQPQISYQNVDDIPFIAGRMKTDSYQLAKTTIQEIKSELGSIITLLPTETQKGITERLNAHLKSINDNLRLNFSNIPISDGAHFGIYDTPSGIQQALLNASNSLGTLAQTLRESALQLQSNSLQTQLENSAGIKDEDLAILGYIKSLLAPSNDTIGAAGQAINLLAKSAAVTGDISPLAQAASDNRSTIQIYACEALNKFGNLINALKPENYLDLANSAISSLCGFIASRSQTSEALSALSNFGEQGIRAMINESKVELGIGNSSVAKLTLDCFAHKAGMENLPSDTIPDVSWRDSALKYCREICASENLFNELGDYVLNAVSKLVNDQEAALKLVKAASKGSYVDEAIERSGLFELPLAA